MSSMNSMGNNAKKELIGELLKRRYGVKEHEIESALHYQRQYGGMLGGILVNMGHVGSESLVEALSEQLGYGLIRNCPTEIYDSESSEIASGKEVCVGVLYLRKRNWLLIAVEQDSLHFVTTDPLNYEVRQHLQKNDFKLIIWLATEVEYREILSRIEIKEMEQGATDNLMIEALGGEEIDRLKELASEAPVVNMVNSLIARAIRFGASDLHLEPYRKMYRIRYRIDGILHDSEYLPGQMMLPVASRIKILAELDIAEKRRPQDGQINMKTGGKEIDIRVSVMPLAEGESLVLRFLVKESISYELESLGIEQDYIAMLNEDVKETAGVLLLSGPTGSGKTTTLYSCLNRINTAERKIITIEDPVEYQLDGINQIQIHPDIGYDFLNALRSILRQDPDIIMVGEIRDGETAKVAMQSSLTGHLVFSTIHTNDAATGFTRLRELGVNDFLVNSSIIGIIAQRLVRRLCTGCAQKSDEKEIASQLSAITKNWYDKEPEMKKAVGCEKCGGTGYRGRVAILEYLHCDKEIKQMDKGSGFQSEVKKYMKEKKIRTLYEDGVLKVVKGVTTMEEVHRVCGYGTI